jgi:hypothetical protein
MSWNHRLDAYTLRLFHKNTHDADLERLYNRAHANRPCIVVLEDLYRAFPRSEESMLLFCKSGAGDCNISKIETAGVSLSPIVLSQHHLVVFEATDYFNRKPFH